MKKLKLLLMGLFCLCLIPIKANAASGTISVSGASTAIVGNKVTVTVTISSSTLIGSWQMDLNYDKNYLQLTGSTAEGNGTRMVDSSAGGTKKKTYTFTFKTLKSGSTRVSISSYLAYAYEDISEMSLTSSSKTIKIMTQAELEATYSKDNYLKALAVEGYELDKEFNKDILEYTINVPTGTTSIKVVATKNDSKSSIDGDGEIEVTEGLNTVPVVVTAQNGSERTYNIIVNVEDQNPINVTIDNKNYTIVKNSTLLTKPNTFDDTTITIDNIEVPAFINKSADITLIGLKDSEGTISLYQYKANKYSKYNEMSLNNLLLVPIAFEKELNFTKTTITINDEKIDAYKYNDKSSLVIINAQSLENGQTSLYLYDTENKTVVKFDESFIEETEDILKNYTYVIIAFAGALVIMLIIIISLLRSLKKKQRKIKNFIQKQEAKMEATRRLNEVVDEVKKITEDEEKDKKEDKEEKGDLTVMLETLSQEQIDSKSKAENKEDQKLSKKELKKLKKEEKKKKATDEVIVKEIKVDNDEVANKKITEETEEIYDLFEEDKKRKKK